jgi:hypothetical protein
MPPLFKDGPQLLERGVDLARRRNFVDAASVFADAARKFQKAGDHQGTALAQAYGQLMHSRPSASNALHLRSLADLLDRLGPAALQPGARPIEAARLAQQVRLAAAELELQAAESRGSLSPSDLAAHYQSLAQSFMELGEEPLYLEELFEGRSVSGTSRVALFSARAEEAIGRSLQQSDPAEAAQHFQSATLWWQQAGEVDRAGAASVQVARLSTRARCWFCGREGAGLGIQLATLPIDVPLSGLVANTGPLPSVEISGRHVYTCSACHSAIRMLADSIAVRHVHDLELRVHAQIEDVRRQLAAHRHP